MGYNEPLSVTGVYHSKGRKIYVIIIIILGPVKTRYTGSTHN